MEAQFWLNLQLGWDLYHAMRAPAAGDLERIQCVDTSARVAGA